MPRDKAEGARHIHSTPIRRRPLLLAVFRRGPLPALFTEVESKPVVGRENSCLNLCGFESAALHSLIVHREGQLASPRMPREATT